MHRFYVPPEQCVGENFGLPEGEAHHALRVLRVRPGETVTVLNGEGTASLCQVTRADARVLELRVLERREAVPPPCRVTLFQAIPKGKTMEDLIHKATELGVNRIVPLITEHVISRPDEKGVVKKAEKWRATAIEAIKQCGQAWLPRVDPPRTMADALAAVETAELELVGALYPGSKHPRVFFERFLAETGRKPESVAVWIGPEGDFTKEEVQSVVRRNACPITLGPLVLKCETAALFTLSIVNYETLPV